MNLHLLIVLGSLAIQTAVPAADGVPCVPGFCPAPDRRGPPPGLMYLSIGLIAAGVSGLWSRRSRADSSE